MISNVRSIQTAWITRTRAMSSVRSYDEKVLVKRIIPIYAILDVFIKNKLDSTFVIVYYWIY